MGTLVLRNNKIDVDIKLELEAYDWGANAKWHYDKLIAASPFRYDKSPSFFVRLEESGEYPAGVWSDSGAYDSDWESGDFVKLLSFLRNETREETEDYLLDQYGPRHDGKITLITRPLRRKQYYATLSVSMITQATSPYLLKRGITAEVQQEAGVGFSKHKGFCALPWHSADGRLLNVKYRATRGKAFFYERDATPIGKLVYGANTIKDASIATILCEAEIDALSYRVAGYQALAIGGVAFSQAQADIIQRLPIGTLVIAGDNDKAGQRFNARAIERLRASNMRLALMQYDDDTIKDANDVLKKTQGIAALRQMVEGALTLPSFKALAYRR